MQKNSITNKITPCCNLPFSVLYWWISNLTLNSENDRQFIISKISQNGTISIDGWKVLVNSGTLEADASLTKAEFLAWFDCGRQPSCEQLKLIIESFKIGNWDYFKNSIEELNEAWQELENKLKLKYNNTSDSEAVDVIQRADQFTGENVNYRETTTWHDGSVMNDSKVDGVIYVKKNNKYYKRIYSYADVRWWGAIPDGVTDCSAAIEAALGSGVNQLNFSEGNYMLSSHITAVLTADLKITGKGKLQYNGGNSNQRLVLINCNGFSLEAEFLSFDGNNAIAGGFHVINNSTTFNRITLRKLISENFKMNVASPYNSGISVEGAVDKLIIDDNTIRNITRLAGTGTPSSSGTSGVFVARLDSTKYIKEFFHTSNYYENILGGDAVGSANNVDHDGLLFINTTPNNKNTTSILRSSGNTYKNCRGRAIKSQCYAKIHNEKIIRDADYTNYGGSSEINLQYGIGEVKDIEFYYYNYGTESPIKTGLTLVSIYQGSDYGEKSGSTVVKGLNVFNEIAEGSTGNNISAILGAQSGAGVQDKNKTLISLTDVSVNNGEVDFLMISNYSNTSNVVIKLDTITVPKLKYSAIGANNTHGKTTLIANNITNLDGIITPENRVKFISNGGSDVIGGNQAFGGKLYGGNNQGFIQSFNRGSDYNVSPQLSNALADQFSGQGGMVSVQTDYIANNDTRIFEERFWGKSRGMIWVVCNESRYAMGTFYCIDSSVILNTADASHKFSLSASGVSASEAGKINLFFSAGKLGIENKLGGAYSFTILFIG